MPDDIIESWFETLVQEAGKNRHDHPEAQKAPLDPADRRGGLRRARLALALDDGVEGASGLEQEKHPTAESSELRNPISGLFWPVEWPSKREGNTPQGR
jgi:hypothetical protein